MRDWRKGTGADCRSCPKAKVEVDTSVLFERLRRKAAKMGLAVYNVYVRKAGVGISYVRTSEESPEPLVYAYEKTLRKAVRYELGVLSSKNGSSWRNGLK